jgi:ribonucleoside-diphosphate reductase alpha chain
VRSTRSRASGPVSYMRVFDRSCETLESADARRGAQMGMLRVDHPDMARFVPAKDERGELTNFDISVSASDAFMRAVIDDGVLELTQTAEPYDRTGGDEKYRRGDGLWVYRRIPARRLFEEITECSFRHGIRAWCSSTR